MALHQALVALQVLGLSSIYCKNTNETVCLTSILVPGDTQSESRYFRHRGAVPPLLCLFVLMYLSCSPKALLLLHRETLLPRREFFIALLSKVKEEGGVLTRITTWRDFFCPTARLDMASLPRGRGALSAAPHLPAVSGAEGLESSVHGFLCLMSPVCCQDHSLS